MIDHRSLFALVVVIPDKSSEIVAHILIEGMIGIFGLPETLHRSGNGF